MNLVTEFHDQIAYFNRIKANLGAYDAARVRLKHFAGKLGLCDPTLISLRHASLMHDVVARTFSTDLDVFWQVFKDKQYDLATDPVPRTIVDCGANVGYTSAFFLSKYPSAHVVAIEPFPSNLEICRQNLAPYGDRVSVRAAAVWSARGRLAFDPISVGNEWAVEVREARPDEAGTVDAIDIPSLGLKSIDLLKVDIERSELELFGPTSARWLPTVSNIMIELHGKKCEEVFFAALSDYDYDLGHSGELTVCRNLRLKHPAPATEVE